MKECVNREAIFKHLQFCVTLESCLHNRVTHCINETHTICIHSYYIHIYTRPSGVAGVDYVSTSSSPPLVHPYRHFTFHTHIQPMDSSSRGVVGMRSCDIILWLASVTRCSRYMQDVQCKRTIILGSPPVVCPSSNRGGYLRCYAKSNAVVVYFDSARFPAFAR